jgi:hypothetical protein
LRDNLVRRPGNVCRPKKMKDKYKDRGRSLGRAGDGLIFFHFRSCLPSFSPIRSLSPDEPLLRLLSSLSHKIRSPLSFTPALPIPNLSFKAVSMIPEPNERVKRCRGMRIEKLMFPSSYSSASRYGVVMDTKVDIQVRLHVSRRDAMKRL